MTCSVLLARLALLCIFVSTSYCQVKTGKTVPVPEKLLSNPCSGRETCHECITFDSECAWCTKEDYTKDGKPRCDTIGNLARTCADHHFHPKNTETRMRDDALSNVGAREGEAIQIKPQEIRLRLRPKTPFPLHIDFKQAEDYPVDLYYLMDLSNSMKDDKDKLANLGDELAEEMGKITSNFRLGFGSFVDKIVMPYVNTVPEKMQSPCDGCVAPYGFKNHLPLSLKTDKFKEQVTAANVSGNLDAPEGGFDAIMQSVVCQQEIGWREKARRLLLFSTDSGFHYAGDGKLGGIVKPNDGKCYMEDGEYTQSVHQDYPSLSQINAKIQEHKVNIIFAVTADQIDVYEKLANELEGCSSGRLENDSSNVVELVQDQYNKISSKIEMKDNIANNYIQITYSSKCLSDKLEKTNICTGLKVGDNVTFEASIEIKSCPKDRSEWNQTFQIYPVGLSDSLTVNLEMVCDCECEQPWNEERDSPKCSGGMGTFECGICNCYENRYGRQCECDAKDTDQAKDEKGCYFPNDTKPCSGRGDCRCGVCECHPRENRDEEVTGKYCECDNFSCDRVDGQLCGGPEQGTCVCGQCECLDTWSGPDCNCRDRNDTCIAPNGKICSGNGECVCGQCRCFETDTERYSGLYCEDCPTCPGKCDAFKDCVLCQVFQTGPLSDAECNTNCSFLAIQAPHIEVTEEGQKLCIFRDEDDCKYTFIYKLEQDNNYIVKAKNERECPEPINILAIILGVIIGIVLIGLALLLIWKLFTTIHDRREFAKFEKERQMAKWDTGENPIYKGAVSTFKNPTYGGKQ
ncbi:integrin beta-PS-like [Ornithodoros turicata]|uniref:integrin beta-PS-like n=1 Tax=Ornithodoros turicata TaxID=34597 RepID=UPI00313947E6